MIAINYDPSRPHAPDMSHWHPVTNESAFVATHPAFVAFKVIQSGGEDPTWRAHDKIGADHDLPRIGYMFDTDGVDAYLRAFPPAKGRIPALDLEGTPTLAEALADATKLHAEHGRYPLVYGRQGWIGFGQPTGTVMENCPGWWPEYGPTLFVPAGAGQTVLHQFFGGIVGPDPHSYPGVASPCDMNSLLVPPSWFRTYAGLAPPTPQYPKFPGRLLKLVKPRMHGADVAAYKHQLIRLGYNVANSDVFGTHAEEATQKFQQRHKLKVDGVVGSATWDAVFRAQR